MVQERLYRNADHIAGDARVAGEELPSRVKLKAAVRECGREVLLYVIRCNDARGGDQDDSPVDIIGIINFCAVASNESFWAKLVIACLGNDHKWNKALEQIQKGGGHAKNKRASVMPILAAEHIKGEVA